jgi:uncharacterized protein YecT (DUF1311 family)
MRVRAVALAALLMPATAHAQDPQFDPGATASCLETAHNLPTKKQCIGTSANICMDSHGGSSTVGMGFCIRSEADYWDGRLNAAYQNLMAREKADDAEMEEIGATAPKKAEALRAMQRAWIPFRDAACEYEYSQWGGGTGGGPAHAACVMQLTGEQALELEARLTDPQ